MSEATSKPKRKRGRPKKKPTPKPKPESVAPGSIPPDAPGPEKTASVIDNIDAEAGSDEQHTPPPGPEPTPEEQERHRTCVETAKLVVTGVQMVLTSLDKEYAPEIDAIQKELPGAPATLALSPTEQNDLGNSVYSVCVVEQWSLDPRTAAWVGLASAAGAIALTRYMAVKELQRRREERLKDVKQSETAAPFDV